MSSSTTPGFSAWKVHSEHFHAILGPSPRLELLLSVEEYPFAHEAGVYIPSTRELFTTSGQFLGPDGQKTIKISKVSLPAFESINAAANLEVIDHAGIPMANGGVNHPHGEGIVFCSQGTREKPSGLIRMSTHGPPYHSTPIVTSFHDRPFNSVNDVVVSERDGCMWFTDPTYGAVQGFRPPPQLPSQVYRFDPETGDIRAVADGFGRPNGLCFSPDESVLYVTDTDQLSGDGSVFPTRASTIYAFDVEYRHDQPFLMNKRLFAFADVGIPDGIKCDLEGNVYSGCGDGVNVWSPGGVLLGRILLEGGVANFCFGEPGEMFILNEHRLFRAVIDPSVGGALLKL